MKQLETFLKLIIIGIVTALVRAYGQGFIPVVEEPLLWPSIFADGGIATLAFVVFGSVFYTAIAALFLLMDKNLRGRKLFKGLKFSLFLIIIWTAYLLEPLPHIIPTDKIAYPIVDGVALLILGILSGLLIATDGRKSTGNQGQVVNHRAVEVDGENSDLGSIVNNILSLEEDETEDHSEAEQQSFMAQDENQGEGVAIDETIAAAEETIADLAMGEGKGALNKVRKGKKYRFSVLNVIIIGLFFFLGRIAMYKYLSIYSYFGTHSVETLLWALGTGLSIGVVFELAAGYICKKTWYLRFLVFGAIYLGAVLIGFNGFKPLIYRMDTVDLALRTLGDCSSVILAGGVCLVFDFKKNLQEAVDKENF